MEKILKRHPWTGEQLKSFVRQELDIIPLLKVQQLLSPIPRCLPTAIKKAETPNSGKRTLSLTCSIEN